MSDFTEKIVKTKRWGAFQKWCSNRPSGYWWLIALGYDDTNETVTFLNMPSPFQQGVFLEFLREHGIDIAIELDRDNDGNTSFYIFEVFIKKQNDTYGFMRPGYNAGLQETILKAFDL